MNREEFINYIETIGFKSNYLNHEYKQYRIAVDRIYYSFFNGSKWVLRIDYNDLTPLIKLDRSNKLKKILG